MGKKRKAEELEADSDLYQKFAKAATAVSLLYTHASQQRRSNQAQGARYALERQFRWLQRDHGGATILPISVLINYLHAELNNVDNLDTADLPHISQAVGLGRGYEGRHGYKTPGKRYSGAHVHHPRKDGYDSGDPGSPKNL